MKKLLTLSLMAISLIANEYVPLKLKGEVVMEKHPLPVTSLSHESGGSLPAIDAYSDGVGVLLIDGLTGGVQTDNSGLNTLVYKYGEIAKEYGKNDENRPGTLKDYVLTNVSDPVDIAIAEKLNDVPEASVSVTSCKELIDAGLFTTNGYYTIQRDETSMEVFCAEGGWTLVGVLNNGYGLNPIKKDNLNYNGENILSDLAYQYILSKSTEGILITFDGGLQYTYPKSWLSGTCGKNHLTLTPGRYNHWANTLFWTDPGCNMTGTDYSGLTQSTKYRVYTYNAKDLKRVKSGKDSGFIRLYAR